MAKVKIELTAEQKKKVHQEMGVEIDTLTYDSLEERAAPKRGPSPQADQGIFQKNLDRPGVGEPFDPLDS